MATTRSPNPNREEAFKIYKKHKGNITNKEIANILNENTRNISSWKTRDRWEEKLNNKVGAPLGNQNAIGNKGGGAPIQNLNALKHGEYYNASKHLEKDFLKKYLPTATKNIIKEAVETGFSMLDILWTNIQLQFAAVLRSQKIMHVKSKTEMIKEVKKSKIKTNDKKTEKTSTNSSEEEYTYEFQFAWDRQATFLQAQSRAMSELRSLIKQYDSLLNANRELATEEQKLRIEKLKADIVKINSSDNPEEELESDGFIEALKGTAQDDWKDEED